MKLGVVLTKKAYKHNHQLFSGIFGYLWKTALTEALFCRNVNSK